MLAVGGIGFGGECFAQLLQKGQKPRQRRVAAGAPIFGELVEEPGRIAIGRDATEAAGAGRDLLPIGLRRLVGLAREILHAPRRVVPLQRLQQVGKEGWACPRQSGSYCIVPSRRRISSGCSCLKTRKSPIARRSIPALIKQATAS